MNVMIEKESFIEKLPLSPREIGGFFVKVLF